MIIAQAHASLQACLQAGWGEIGGIGKMLQPEAIEKQAGWGKIGGIGKMPQPEAIEKHDMYPEFWTHIYELG